MHDQMNRKAAGVVGEQTATTTRETVPGMAAETRSYLEQGDGSCGEMLLPDFSSLAIGDGDKSSSSTK